jgi:hypothetical protein
MLVAIYYSCVFHKSWGDVTNCTMFHPSGDFLRSAIIVATDISSLRDCTTAQIAERCNVGSYMLLVGISQIPEGCDELHNVSSLGIALIQSFTTQSK